VAVAAVDIDPTSAFTRAYSESAKSPQSQTISSLCAAQCCVITPVSPLPAAVDRRGDGSKVLHRPRSQRQKLAYIYFEDSGDGERRRSCSRVMPPRRCLARE